MWAWEAQAEVDLELLYSQRNREHACSVFPEHQEAREGGRMRLAWNQATNREEDCLLAQAKLQEGGIRRAGLTTPGDLSASAY